MNKEYLKKSVIYQAFIRNETEEGTIKAFIPMLDEIAKLGADILYVLPVQLIGTLGRKGKLGSPYAIRDYESINPELGTWEDYKELVEATHAHGMKFMQDIVFNHMAKDSVQIEKNPDFFYKDKTGKMGNKAGNWSDVTDLDHNCEELEEYLVSLLMNFKKMGVDGFRFDVASLIPASFYKKARKALGDEMIWLAENVDTPFIQYVRGLGFTANSNNELADAGFDLFYPYGSRFVFEMYAKSGWKKEYLDAFKAALAIEQANLPKEKYISMAIENHDRERIASYGSQSTVENLLAFSFFFKGPAFIYSGEEIGAAHRPSLFDKDLIDFKNKNKETRKFISKLVDLKHRDCNLSLLSSDFPIFDNDLLVVVNSFENGDREFGVFSFKGDEYCISSKEIPIGRYIDLLSGDEISISINDTLKFSKPLWLRKD